MACIGLMLVSCARVAKSNQNKDTEENIEESIYFANAALTVYIYQQAYYSIDKVKELCQGRKIDTYLKLAEETYSILSYKEIEKALTPDALEKIRTRASALFFDEYGGFEDKAFICAFIEASPYDVIVGSGIKLMEYSDNYAKKIEYKSDYDEFKETIFSYIPKMAVNEEAKEEIMNYVKKFR